MLPIDPNLLTDRADREWRARARQLHEDGLRRRAEAREASQAAAAQWGHRQHPITPTTLAIRDVVTETPGCTTKWVATTTGLSVDTSRYHLRKLLDAQLIDRERDGLTDLWWPVEAPE